jgi:hypothetical protein
VPALTDSARDLAFERVWVVLALPIPLMFLAWGSDDAAMRIIAIAYPAAMAVICFANAAGLGRHEATRLERLLSGLVLAAVATACLVA